MEGTALTEEEKFQLGIIDSTSLTIQFRVAAILRDAKAQLWGWMECSGG
jgi:hypothetical protein